MAARGKLILLGALATGVAAFLLVSLLRSRPDRAGTAPLDPSREAGQAERPGPELAESAKVPAVGQPDGERRAVPMPAAPVAGRAKILHGRIEFPPGTPRDEAVALVLRGCTTSADWTDLGSVSMAIAGSFQFELPGGWKRFEVVLSARYLILDVVRTLDPSSLPDVLVLAPRLGARIQGRLVPPPAAPQLAEAWIGASARLITSRPTGPGSWRQEGESNTNVAPDLTFAFDALEPEHMFELRVEQTGQVRLSREMLRVTAGETTELLLDLEIGVRISGRVVDEDGRGTEAAVHVQWSRGGWTRGADGPRVGRDGRFEIVSRAGSIELAASRVGFLRTCRSLGELVDGDVRDGVELVLHRGASVSGQVLWPNGNLVAGCEVEIEQAQDPRASEACWQELKRELQTGPDGRFELSGLLARTCTITARSDAFEGRETAGIAGPPVARLEQVAPGSKDLVLVLGVGGALAGVVVDDAGAGVEDFEVSVADWRPGQYGPGGSRGSVQRFRGTGGKFRSGGIADRRVTLEVRAPGHVTASLAPVELPAPSLRIVLPRLGSIAGTIVDPSQAPVGGARVQTWSPWRGQDRLGDDQAEMIADENGRFELPEVPPGNLRLTARAPGFAHSSPIDVDVPPGGSAGAVTLVLRRSGRIEGVVLDGSGDPIASGSVTLHRPLGSTDEATTDDRGRFAFPDVPPGTHFVQAHPRDDMRGGAVNEPRALGRMSAPVLVEEGKLARVTLGGPRAIAVRVRGMLRRSGSGLGGAEIHAWEDMHGSWAACTTDGSGRFVLELDWTGETSFRLGSTHLLALNVPQTQELELDLDVPVGRIRGSVVDASGSPLAGIHVLARRESRPVQRWGGGFAATAADGSFTFEGLLDGTYSVSARESNQAADRGLAPTIADGIVVGSGATVEGVVLVLGKGGRIEVLVRDARGVPVPGASVLAFDGRGRWLTWSRNSSTDGQGRLTLESAPPGRVRVLARTSNGATPATGVDVQSGATARVEMTIGSGTWLCVLPVDGAGAAIEADVAVRDEQGNDCSGEWPAYGAGVELGIQDVRTQLVGPVAPGVYRISAVDSGGRRASSEVRANGEKQLAVRLRLE